MVSMDPKSTTSSTLSAPRGDTSAPNSNSSFRSADLKLFVRDVRDGLRKKRPITVRSWSTIKDVKDVIQQVMQIPSSSQRLYFGPLLTSGGELPNHRTLPDAGIDRSGYTLLLDIKGSAGSPCFSSLYSLSPSNTNDVCISSSMMDSTPRPLKALVQEARRGFALGFKPELVLEGSGGTYVLHDTRKARIAIFKPADEEPYAANNPRGYLQQPGQPLSLREGVAPGQACIREVAAYLLDHEGFSGVPMTTLAEARHPAFNTNGARLKVSEGGASMGAHSISNTNLNGMHVDATFKKAGSFQEFVRVDCTMDDISPSKISVEQVHKIAILDMRILNADRNAANLLVRQCMDRDELELVPIDHGYCLRSVADVSWMDWCWLDWPQLKQPLSDKHRKYIQNLDIEADARMLRERLNICQEAIDYFRASSALLKAGVKAGLCLYDIACMCCRNDNLAEVPSMLEKLLDMADELATVAMENDRWDHTAASRALVEQLSPAGKRRSSTLSRVSTAAGRLSKPSDMELYQSLLSREDSTGASGLTRALQGRDSPALLAQSSASDSSSEAGEGDIGCDGPDKDTCEEWAASIILDVSVDPLIPTHHRNGRSSSITSDDASSDSGLSSSPKGFWLVRPGSTVLVPNSDDSSVSWSPCPSPRPSPRSSLANSDRSDGSSPTNFLLDENQEPQVLKPTATVTFAIIAPGPFLPPQSAMKVSPFKAQPTEGNFSPLLRSESGMSRSKSYSALSAAGTSKASHHHHHHHHRGPHRHHHHGRKDFGDKYEIYRKYFLNFIDLVIVRETAAAVHHSKFAKQEAHPVSALTKATS